MIYHSQHASFYGAYRGAEILSRALFLEAKKHPYIVSTVAIGALTLYCLSKKESIKEEIQNRFFSQKLAVRQKNC